MILFVNCVYITILKRKINLSDCCMFCNIGLCCTCDPWYIYSYIFALNTLSVCLIVVFIHCAKYSCILSRRPPWVLIFHIQFLLKFILGCLLGLTDPNSAHLELAKCAWQGFYGPHLHFIVDTAITQIAFEPVVECISCSQIEIWLHCPLSLSDTTVYEKYTT